MKRIQRTQHVLTGAPVWRNEDGKTLAECVATWLKVQEDMGRFPLTEDAAGAIAAGRWCGVRVWCGLGVSYLITPAAMTACITGAGLDCDTPAELHDVLFELVQEGYLRQEVEKHALPGLRRRMVLYCIEDSIMECIHRPAAAARLVPTEGLPC